MVSVRSGDAVCRVDEDGVIAEWNEAAERLTGIAAAEAHGRYCWEVIAGRDATGGIVCHPGCSVARLAREGWAVQRTDLFVGTRAGRKRLTLSTIVVRTDTEVIVLHPMRESTEPLALAGPRPRLTPRQHEILSFLGHGVLVKEIACRLSLSETTVRNHIRAILIALGAHSQLEAVARARAHGLLGGSLPEL